MTSKWCPSGFKIPQLRDRVRQNTQSATSYSRCLTNKTLQADSKDNFRKAAGTSGLKKDDVAPIRDELTLKMHKLEYEYKVDYEKMKAYPKEKMDVDKGN